jgi:hypothetical protein
VVVGVDFGTDLRKSRETGAWGFSLLLLLLLMDVLGLGVLDCKSNKLG